MKLSNIVTFFTKHKRMITFSIAFSCMYFLLGLENTVFAAGTDTEGWGTVVTVVNGALKFVALFLALMTYLVSLFLSPEWMNGSLFGIQGYLKTIWVMVSNIVYIVFAFILIGIAFMNIVGVGQDKFQLKQSLPKFIIGILIVPFSWFLVTFMLSLASVLSVIAVNLPFDSFKGYENNLADLKLPTKCTIDMTGNTSANEKRELEVTKYFFCDDESPIKRTENNSETIYLVVALYTYGIMGIDTTDMLQHDFLSSDTVVDIFDIIVKIVFDLLFFAVYAILIIALGLVLMIRGFNLWIYIMFSPVFGLMYFFGKNSGGSGFFEKFNVKEFLALAMVPVYSMLALSFGMLFLYIVGQGMTTSSLIYKDAGVRLTGADANTKAETLEIGEFALTFVGPLSSTWGNIGDGTEDVLAGGKIGAGIVLGAFGSLILKIMGIVVLWGTMMAALKSSKITAAIVEPLDQFGKSVGQIVQKAPTYAPVFGGQSMASMANIGQMYQSDLNSQASKRAGKFHEKYDIFGGGKYATAMNEVLQDMKGITNPTKIADTINKGLKAMSNLEQINSKEMVAAIRALAENNRSGLSSETTKYLLDNVKNGMTQKQMMDALSYINVNEKEVDGIAGAGDDDIIQSHVFENYINKEGVSTDGTATSKVFNNKHSFATGDKVQVRENKEHKIIDIKVSNRSDIENLSRGLGFNIDRDRKEIDSTEIGFTEKLREDFSYIPDDTRDKIINAIKDQNFAFGFTGTGTGTGTGTTS